MIFQLKSTILTLALVASLLLQNNVSAVDQQQQLRGSKINSNNSQRVMASFCPEKAPKDGASCAGVLSANMSSGNCEWHSSSTDSKGVDLTENTYCKCTNNGTPTWACSMDAESSTTSPPVAAPTTPPAAGATTGGKNWCPSNVPAKTSVSCPLPNGLSSGACTYWSQDTHAVTTKNVCSCTRKDAYAHPSAPASPFVCVQTKS